MPPSERIFLTGYRGTGKSTVARLVAAQLGWDWCDADQVLEEQLGKTIAEVFAAEGEPGFRRHESAILDDLCQRSRHVIATGGGVILAEANRAKLTQSGTVVWLTASPRTIHDRLQQDATTASRRPALTVGGLTEIEEVLRLREPLYANCANITIATEGHDAADVARQVLAELYSAHH